MAAATELYRVLLPQGGAPALDDFVPKREAELWAMLGYMCFTVSMPAKPMDRPSIIYFNFEEPT